MLAFCSDWRHLQWECGSYQLARTYLPSCSLSSQRQLPWVGLLSSAQTVLAGSARKARRPARTSLTLRFCRAAGWGMTLLVPAAAAAVPPSEGGGFCCHVACGPDVPLLSLLPALVPATPRPMCRQARPPPPQRGPRGAQ